MKTFPSVKRVAWALFLSVVFAFVACANGPQVVDHAFGFDAVADSPGIDVLDYRYGQSNMIGTRMPDWVKTSIGRAGEPV